MKNSLPVLLFSATIAVLSGCATMNIKEPDPVTLEQIVAMAKEGKDGPTIIGEIKKSGTVYDVTASQYAKLSRDGVPDAVLDFMQSGQLKMAEQQGRREAANDLWFYGPNWGWGFPLGPRPYIVYIQGRPYVRYW